LFPLSFLSFDDGIHTLVYSRTIYILSGQTISAGDQEDLPNHAADDSDREKGGASIGPFVKLRLRDTGASAADAPTYSQPGDEYRQETARRSYDLRLKRACKACPIHLNDLEYISNQNISDPRKKYKKALN
jgi:hypothetical protein